MERSASNGKANMVCHMVGSLETQIFTYNSGIATFPKIFFTLRACVKPQLPRPDRPASHGRLRQAGPFPGMRGPHQLWLKTSVPWHHLQPVVHRDHFGCLVQVDL